MVLFRKGSRRAILVVIAAVAAVTKKNAVIIQQPRDRVGLLGAQAFQPLLLPSVDRRLKFSTTTTVLHSTRKRNRASQSTSQFSDDNDDDESSEAFDDEWLLQTVTQEQLLDLCEQLQLDLGEGVAGSSLASPSNTNINSKAELLRRLRAYAAQQRHAEEVRRKERDECVERGSRDDASKERYETVTDNEASGSFLDDDDDDFYIALPVLGGGDSSRASSSTVSDGSLKQEPKGLDIASKSSLDDKAATLETSQGDQRPRSPTGWTSSAFVTAPPPPEHVNDDGERAVTIYSSTDHNDLTGIAAAQPGYGAASAAAATESGAPQPWDAKAAASNPASSRQVDSAREMLSELVRCLLATSGAPAFIAGYDDDDDENDDDGMYAVTEHGGDIDLSHQVRQFFRGRRHHHGAGKNVMPADFVGFQPGSVPTPLLVAASPSLRLQRGQVLRDVLRQFELEAIGHDGRAGDNRESGGGHYREVAKVSAFLEGYRTSEVRRLARETTALLLDKLVQEGVEGLDVALATMARSSDDYRSDHAGELNDSLLEYLGDAIRQQEVKVRTESAALPERQPPASDVRHDDADDNLSSLWTVEAGEDGHRVESIDPSDPNVREALQREYSRNHEWVGEDRHSTKSPTEQLLFLLQLLKKRVEAEAAFAPDEKGRNLRLLAYCLRLGSDSEREQLIQKEVGNSLDRIDSFMELVASSIEYGESTSHQLQPSKTQPLNVRGLQGIQDLCRQIRQRQPR